MRVFQPFKQQSHGKACLHFIGWFVPTILMLTFSMRKLLSPQLIYFGYVPNTGLGITQFVETFYIQYLSLENQVLGPWARSHLVLGPWTLLHLVLEPSAPNSGTWILFRISTGVWRRFTPSIGTWSPRTGTWNSFTHSTGALNHLHLVLWLDSFYT